MSKILGKIGAIKTVVPSPAYIACFPGGQPTTDTELIDRSGNGRNATLGANLTAANAFGTTPGKLSTTYGTNDGGCVLTQQQMGSFTYGLDTLFVFFRAILTAPAANSGVFGARTKGIAIRLITTGVVDAVVNKDSGDNFLTAPAGNWADGVEHSHLFVFDSVNLKMYVYNNANVNSAITAAGTAMTAGTITGNTTGWRIGGFSNAVTCTGKFQTFHIMRKTGGVTSTQVAALANRLHHASHTMLSRLELPDT